MYSYFFKMSSNNLTDEERARIQQNRQNALELRKEKLRNAPPSTTTAPSIERSVSDTQIKLSAPTTTTPTKNSSNNLTDEQRARMEQSREKALALRMEKLRNAPSTTTAPSIAIKLGEKKVEIKCVLIANHRFEARCPYCEEAIDIFRTVHEASYNASTKTWSFPLSSYREFEQKIRASASIAYDPLPPHITSTFAKYISDPSASAASSKLEEFDLSSVDEHILTRLFPFQKECINFAISRGGRVLIADDMGLGKTVEALGILSYYRDDWPALIVCPASLKYTWKQAIIDWLPSSIKKKQVAVIDKNTDIDLIGKKSMRIAVVSYGLVTNIEEHMMEIGKKFTSVVLDESHYIKNADAQRTKACERILETAKRVILLTGTPALSRPCELYTQLNVVDPNLFPSFTQFGTRYCDPKTVKIWNNQMGIDYRGASNMEELEALLRETIMIRRVKEDVLHQLPAKIRGIISLNPRLVAMDKGEKKKAARINDDRLNSAERSSAMLDFWRATATAKLRAVTNYVLELLESNKKFLLFAHHRVMLDYLESEIAETSYEAIRIDGTTPAIERKRLCDRFQADDAVRVALLSITATGTGLTLTAANVVVFGELYWTPGVLVQAEDRAHRIGQSDSVLVQYLIAQGTADDLIWPLIQRKLDTLNKGGLSKGAFKADETTRIEPGGNQEQSSILDFMESISGEDLLAMDLDQASAMMTPSPAKKARITPATPIRSTMKINPTFGT